jgi:hypothetical protein
MFKNNARAFLEPIDFKKMSRVVTRSLKKQLEHVRHQCSGTWTRIK